MSTTQLVQEEVAPARGELHCLTPSGAAQPELRANILMVDDRPDKLLALEAILGDLGQNIVKANSGKEALRCLLKQDFAVILLDVSMPGMDGFETAALIRARPRSERTPIIFITSFGNNDTHMSRGYSLGAVDYMHTPILPEVLRTKVSVFVELYKQTEEIRRLNSELQNQVTALTGANAELEAFNYSIAHDLRAPLRSMGSFADALLEDEADRLSPQGVEFATRIVRSAKYMDTLLHDLLAYSGLARTQMTREEVDLDGLIQETLSLFTSQICSREVKVEVVSPLGKVMAHLPTLRQVVNNLVDNALKFCSPDRAPCVRIYVTSQDGLRRLWVEDNGIGIAPEHHERIFGLFRRLHHSDAYPGTGIGLAIVKRAAERMGGNAGVESTPGQGSRFWIGFPGILVAQA